MNRTLKFRVWDLEKKKFDYFNLYSDIFNPKNYSNPTIQQYTGFSDSRGQDIYEGDYIELQNCFFGIVIFFGSEFIVKRVENAKMPFSFFEEIKLEKMLSSFDDVSMDKLVVGNIFETEVEPIEKFHPKDVNIVNPSPYNNFKKYENQ